jgi:sodium-dependent dicarboxylate transporter 2/3/5
VTLRTIGFWGGLVGGGFLLWGLDLAPEQPQVGPMLALVFLVGLWWITEPVPLAVTSLIPLVAFPLLGILTAKDTASTYINSTIFLFLGGMLLALAMEKWNLHRRIALHILVLSGSSPARLVFGFMLAAALLSMWISNTATALMMLPMAMGVLARLEEAHGVEKIRPLGICLMLSLAYACSIGGMATPIGTPTNLVLRQMYAELFPASAPIGFGSWMLMGVPLALAMLAFAWWLLTQCLFRSDRQLCLPQTELRGELRSLGRLSREEGLVLGVFLLTVLLWITREDLSVFHLVLPGWSGLIFSPQLADKIDDTTVVIATVLLLFFLPSTRHGERILDEKVFARLPWGLVLLFGGGFALAKGFGESGLSAYLASKIFSDLGSASPWVSIVTVCLVMTFLTEFTSNVASTQLVLPLLAALAVAQGLSPLLLMIPATFSASMAFMLPVATPPNAVAFASGRLRVSEMCRAGLLLNLVGVGLVSLVVYYLGAPIWTLPR